MLGVTHGVPTPHRAGRSLRIGSLVVLPTAALLTAATFRDPPSAIEARTSVRELSPTRLPERGERLLVFAPHPDDETLALGGVIAASRKRGAEVRVVYFTSGDGFPLCAAAGFQRWPGRALMDRLGGVREQEALRALARLGLPPGSATFLRFPDRGLAPLWLDHWTGTPYTSPYTGRTSGPPEDENPGAPYLGAALLAGTERLLRREQPDFVYYPDPADDHPDHWAAHCFVRMALARTREERTRRPVHARTYLVHRGAWPRPLDGCELLPLTPPAALARLDAEWERHDLSAELLAAKRGALAAYASQNAVAGGFLSSFLRRNELLSSWKEATADLERGRRGESAARLFSATFPDSTRDRWGRARCGAVDFTGLEVRAAERGLTLAARLRAPAEGWPEYRLYWKPLDGAPGSVRTHRCRISGFRSDPPGTRFRIRDEEIQVLLPRSKTGSSGKIMIGGEVWSGPFLLDRTPWRVVSIR